MTISFQQTDTAGSFSLGAFGTGASLWAFTKPSTVLSAPSSGGSAGSADDVVGASGAASGIAIEWQTDNIFTLYSGGSTPVGVWQVRLNVTTAATGTLACTDCWIVHTNGSGTAIETLGHNGSPGISLTSTGVKSINVTCNASLSPSNGDAIVVILAFSQSAADSFHFTSSQVIFPPAAAPPTFQPSQRFDPVQEYNAIWWQASQYQPHLLPPNYIPQPPPTFQPSQRFDPFPEAAASWVPWQPPPPKLLLTGLIAPPTVRADQRHDPLPDFNAVWWQPPPRKTLQANALPAPRQPDQRAYPAPPADFHWWQTPVKACPSVATASRVPTRQADQRFDLPIAFDFVWWEPTAKIVQPSGGLVARQPDQRFDAPPVFNAVWWTPAARLPLLGAVQIVRQPDQRFDAPAPLDFLWWQVQARALPPAPAQPRPPAALPFPAAPDLGFSWWTPARPFPFLTVAPPTRQPDQRFDAPPLDLTAWLQIPPRQIPAAPAFPTRQPDQRFYPAAPDLTAWLTVSPRQLPSAAAPTLLRQPDQRFDRAADPGFFWWTPTGRALPLAATSGPTRRHDQRFDPLPEWGWVWWQRPALLTMPTALILGPPRFGNRGFYTPGGRNLGGKGL